MSGILTIQGIQTEIPEGEKLFNFSIQLGTVAVSNGYMLGSGTTAIPVPQENPPCNGVIVIAPPGNTNTLGISGSASGTPINMNKNGLAIIQFDPTNIPANIYLTAGAAMTFPVTVTFF